ncbi:Swt1 family HEPN domain-containing protein [Cupriavidus sp. LEh21]|nr:Swt1 family HEPN domain-containing protein [Cupriavidus sp. LEh21]MDK2660788.1 Swt1 family HEPN domain-containing protein [Cupriavidus sp. LEh21]
MRKRGAHNKSRLMTYSQLLGVIEHCWKNYFAELIRDKALLQDARLIAHLRNTICQMMEISEEEINRVRQTMRDWFRIVAP